MEPFQDEPVRIVVTAGGIPQPAMRDKAAFRHALLTDDEKACVCHDIIRIVVEVSFHAVYLDTLADIARNDSSVITPVSYTHLDVYKRQKQMMAKNAANNFALIPIGRSGSL